MNKFENSQSIPSVEKSEKEKEISETEIYPVINTQLQQRYDLSLIHISEPTRPY